MPETKPVHRKPSLFLRLFLSHLILLAIAFVAVVFVFEYLFEPGIKYFLMHKPLIVLPVMLALIGFAGVLAAWSAGVVADPMESITEALDSDDPVRFMRQRPDTWDTLESAELAEKLVLYQERILSTEQRKKVQASRAQTAKTIAVTVSRTGIVLSANLAAEIFTGKSRQELLYGVFAEYFAHEGSDRKALLEALASFTPIRNLTSRAKDMSGALRDIAWQSMPVYDTMGNQTGTLLFGSFPDD